jgi:tetratricopeptide (TPR) repeat protein
VTVANRAAGIAAALLTATAIAVGPARAADEGRVLRLRAESLASADRCEEAIPVAQQARALAPADGRAALVEGRCLIRLRRYDDAVPPLEMARRLDPSLHEATVELAIAHYHLGQKEDAQAELAAAEELLPERAEVHLYRGLLLLEAAQGEEAGETLERAARLGPGEVEPLASYYAGLAWESEDQDERARIALQRAIDADPDSIWAQEARRALDRIDARTNRRWWARVTAGAEWDSNVVLRGPGVRLGGSDVQLAEEVSDEDDWRAVWGAEAGLELYRDADWSAGVIAGYGGSAHADLDDFDLHYPYASLWLDRRIDEHTFVRLQPSFGYALLRDDDYLLLHGGAASVLRDWGAAGAGELFFLLRRHDYLFGVADVPDGAPGGVAGSPCPPSPPTPNGCSPFGLDESRERNRDGNEFVVGYDHTYPFGKSLILEGGLRWHRYVARGSEYDYFGYQIRWGGRLELPFDFAIDAEGSYMYRPYDGESTFPEFVVPGFQYGLDTGSRDDHVWLSDVRLERPIVEHVTASVRWTYVSNISNVKVFDYRRHVVGAYVTVDFGS